MVRASRICNVKLEIYQINAFSNQSFQGNPACVVPLKEWLPDHVLLSIAQENAVAETAFYILSNQHVQLRWFTPELEMDLCGHASLAAAHCLFRSTEFLGNKIEFHTRSGKLNVTYTEGLYHLDLPSRMPQPTSLPGQIQKAISIQPKEVYKSRDYLLLYDCEEQIKSININKVYFDQINLQTGGVIVTSPSDTWDFVSRFFTPQASILEDPVTGSAHCSLIPFWSLRLKKNRLIARQISKRGGTLKCENRKERVIISGTAKTYLKGSIWI